MFAMNYSPFKIFILCLGISIISTTPACDKDECTNFITQGTDLIVSDLVLPKILGIPVNTPQPLGVKIRNVVQSGIECVLAVSAPRNKIASDLYREDENNSGSFQFAGRAFDDFVGELAAEEEEEVTGEIEFMVSGKYYVEGIADVDNVVDEENEDNNNLSSRDSGEFVDAGKTSSGFITVLPSDNPELEEYYKSQGIYFIFKKKEKTDADIHKEK